MKKIISLVVCCCIMLAGIGFPVAHADSDPTAEAYNKGIKLIQAGQYDEAMAIFRGITTRDMTEEILMCKYAKANALAAQDKCSLEAASLYLELKDKADSADRAKVMLNNIRNEAFSLWQNLEATEAAKLFKWLQKHDSSMDYSAALKSCDYWNSITPESDIVSVKAYLDLTNVKAISDVGNYFYGEEYDIFVPITYSGEIAILFEDSSIDISIYQDYIKSFEPDCMIMIVHNQKLTEPAHIADAAITLSVSLHKLCPVVSCFSDGNTAFKAALETLQILSGKYHVLFNSNVFSVFNMDWEDFSDEDLGNIMNLYFKHNNLGTLEIYDFETPSNIQPVSSNIETAIKNLGNKIYKVSCDDTNILESAIKNGLISWAIGNLFLDFTQYSVIAD